MTATAERGDLLPPGVRRTYSSPEVAKFFRRKVQWVYWGLRPKWWADGTFGPPWTHEDGSPIEPERVGNKDERRFTLGDIREIALARYRRHDQTEAQTNRYLRRIEAVGRGEASLLPARRERKSA